MSPDTVSLQIAGRRIERFLSYTIAVDLYTPADAFSLEIANPETEIKRGQRCELYVNGNLELTGIIDKSSRKYGKSGLTTRIEGRDLMGLLVDSHCEQFVDVEGMKLSDLAEMLLKTVPFINRKTIQYQENVVGKLRTHKHHHGSDQSLMGSMDSPQKVSRIEPGMTVFEALRTYAASRGLMFFALPDGTFVFGRPKAKGEPLFSLTCVETGVGNNILEGEEVDDISKRFSKITVLGQQQGQEEFMMDATKITTHGSVTDPDFPFYKPFVVRDNNDSKSPELHARFILEHQRHQGYQLHYKVQSHSQKGKNWQVNELCRVRDEELGIDGVYLIYGRTMERSRQGGTTTNLKLGMPGLVQ